LREGGADYILAVDGHGPGRSFIPEMMIEGAEYLVGKPRPRNLFGMDESFCGLVFLGYHAMMGTPDGVLNHTQNSKIEKRYWYDGVESGEMAQIAMIAGSFGVPVIMVTGDEATCREAINFFGPEIGTVPVKKGVSRESAILYPYERTRKAIKEGAVKAMGNIEKCKPYEARFPMKARYTDKTDVVIEKHINSVDEILNFYND
jgi:D-amino peptidase